MVLVRGIALVAEGTVFSPSSLDPRLTITSVRLATSLFGEATSFLGPAATSIVNDVHEVVTPNAYVILTAHAHCSTS